MSMGFHPFLLLFRPFQRVMGRRAIVINAIMHAVCVRCVDREEVI